MRSSTQRRESVFKERLPPNNRSNREPSCEEGISVATLCLWCDKARVGGRLAPDAEQGHSDKGSSSDRLVAVLEIAGLNEAQLAEYYRQSGVYPGQTEARRIACGQANDWQRTWPGRSRAAAISPALYRRPPVWPFAR